jgi:hypothetical protein
VCRRDARTRRRRSRQGRCARVKAPSRRSRFAPAKAQSRRSRFAPAKAQSRRRSATGRRHLHFGLQRFRRACATGRCRSWSGAGRRRRCRSGVGRRRCSQSGVRQRRRWFGSGRDRPAFGGRRDGRWLGVRGRCRRWIGLPRRGCRQRVAAGRSGRWSSPRAARCRSARCSWAARRVGRTAGWPGATAYSRPRTAIRWTHQRSARPPRPATRRWDAARSGVARVVRAGCLPQAQSTGCRNATSVRLESPSCAACTGRCRTRTLFRRSLHCLAPKTCAISRLTGAPQERPAT